LLNKNISKRIKPQDIPFHPFFQGIDFNEIEKMDFEAPIKPVVKNELDYSNIDPVFLNEEINSPYVKVKQYFDDSQFKDF